MPTRPRSHRQLCLLLASLAVSPVSYFVFRGGQFKAFLVVVGLQVVLGLAAMWPSSRPSSARILLSILGAFSVLGALAGLAIGTYLSIIESFRGGFTGGAWGRPLRLRGKILHPSLRTGSDWTRGERPEVAGLDRATRAALEALWLHDAQKEHASVPAFSRLSWMLAAVGAPAELLQGAHEAALEEIDHTRRCFALAGGYGGRSHSVEAMPDLLVGGLDVKGDPLEHLALESLKDGCLLEDFNADVAAACEAACEDRVTKDVLSRIAREERSHAEFSWGALIWLAERGGPAVERALVKAVAAFPEIARPTAVPAQHRALVASADVARLRAHGRISDEEWASLWGKRVEATQRRAAGILARGRAAAA